MSHLSLKPKKWGDGEMRQAWRWDHVTDSMLIDLREAREDALTSLRRVCTNTQQMTVVATAATRLDVIEELIQAIEEAGKGKDEDE